MRSAPRDRAPRCGGRWIRPAPPGPRKPAGQALQAALARPAQILPDRGRRRVPRSISVPGIAAPRPRPKGSCRPSNELFQAAKRRARGYGRLCTTRMVILMIAGKLDFSPHRPVRHRTAHSFFNRAGISREPVRGVSPARPTSRPVHRPQRAIAIRAQARNSGQVAAVKKWAHWRKRHMRVPRIRHRLLVAEPLHA